MTRLIRYNEIPSPKGEKRRTCQVVGPKITVEKEGPYPPKLEPYTFPIAPKPTFPHSLQGTHQKYSKEPSNKKEGCTRRVQLTLVRSLAT